MTICGTHEYMAPEMLFQEEYTSAVDIFSLGMVFIEVSVDFSLGRECGAILFTAEKCERIVIQRDGVRGRV